MKLSYIALPILGALLSACDPTYGVNTSLKLPGPFDTACIDLAIRSTPGFGAVELNRNQDESFEIAPHWGHVTETTTYWSYGRFESGTGDLHAILQIHQSAEHSEIENGLMRLGLKIPAEQTKKYFPLMQEVNNSVETRCGIPLSSKGTVKQF